MQFKDLRKNTTGIPTYDITAVISGEVSLERSYCMNEQEVEKFLRDCLTETVLLDIKEFRLHHKERLGSSSIWEAEAIVQGRMQSTKPLPRDEVRKMVQDLVQKAGFENVNVDVRKSDKLPEEEPQEPSDSEIADMTKKFVKDRYPVTEPVPVKEALSLKKGDRILVSRVGFQEEAEILSVDPSDLTLEVRTDYGYAPEWVSVTRVLDVIKKTKS